MGPAAAFFDIDGTLVVATSLESCFLRLALRRRAVGPAALLRNLRTGLTSLGLPPSRQGPSVPIPPSLPFLTRLRYALLSGNKSYLQGVRLETCQSLAEAAFRSEVLPRLSQQGTSRVQWHQNEGHLVVLLTGTLDFLGEPLRAHLEGDLLLAARPEVVSGRLTGRLVEPHPYGARKLELLLRLAELKQLDLAACYAYADHHTDVPFLESVGYPVAVNPDRRLARCARERGWAVESF